MSNTPTKQKYRDVIKIFKNILFYIYIREASWGNGQLKEIANKIKIFYSFDLILLYRNQLFVNNDIYLSIIYLLDLKSSILFLWCPSNSTSLVLFKFRIKFPHSVYFFPLIPFILSFIHLIIFDFSFSHTKHLFKYTKEIIKMINTWQ